MTIILLVPCSRKCTITLDSCGSSFKLIKWGMVCFFFCLSPWPPPSASSLRDISTCNKHKETWLFRCKLEFSKTQTWFFSCWLGFSKIQTWISSSEANLNYTKRKPEFTKTQTWIEQNADLNSTKVKLPWFLRVGLPLRPNGISDFDILLFVFAFCFVFSFWYFGFGFWVLSCVRFCV